MTSCCRDKKRKGDSSLSVVSFVSSAKSSYWTSEENSFVFLESKEFGEMKKKTTLAGLLILGCGWKARCSGKARVQTDRNWWALQSRDKRDKVSDSTIRLWNFPPHPDLYYQGLLTVVSCTQFHQEKIQETKQVKDHNLKTIIIRFRYDRELCRLRI